MAAADVRSRFPGLSDGWVRFDGPAGTLPVDTCVDAIADYMRSPNPANLGGYFAASVESQKVVDAARSGVARLVGVHPDEVVSYISPAECQVSYNPLQMALLWNSLATREVNLLQQALEHRHNLPDGAAWVNYVRSHDDIGWTFADEDAIHFGINGFDHRQFLNRYFVNRFEGSFARGVPFQDNPTTGDCRISGTAASLCGLEQHDPHAVARLLLMYGVVFSSGGIPLIYLGDEVGTLNDPDYINDPGKAGDSRWVHRPARDAARYA